MRSAKDQRSLAITGYRRAPGRRTGNIELSDSARCLKRKGTFPERLNLNHTGAIGLLVQAVPGLSRTLPALRALMMSMGMMVDDYGGWLRLHLVMNRHR